MGVPMHTLLFLAVLGTAAMTFIAGAEDGSYRNSSNVGKVMSRSKRRAYCKKWSEWQCRDGGCIPSESKCDGVIDCADGSDERHAICRNMMCQKNWFRCTYGACVDGTAPCNGIQECADNSDELLPRCRNEIVTSSREFKCLDGQVIPGVNRCDGVEHCDDKSDEILATCADTRCPSYFFQCEYGACVDHGADCDEKIDCADGSDEDYILCNKTLPIEDFLSIPTRCILPPYPEHGSYVADVPASPGDYFNDGLINFSCADGFTIIGQSNVTCFKGKWQSKFPTCDRVCKLERKINVVFDCLLSGDSRGTRPCKDFEPIGTKATHTCATNYLKDPNYRGYMVCRESGWVNVPKCLADCGTVSPYGVPMVSNGRVAKRGELPWHAGIYEKKINDTTGNLHYSQICGGTLISSTMVVSAAHCFWDDDQVKPADLYAVALGKVFRRWKTHEDDSQKSNVKELHIAEHFMGPFNLFQSDIALIILETPIVYLQHIRPVCVDFDPVAAKEELRQGVFGKVAGWGLISANSNPSKKLKVVELPYVEFGECRAQSLEEFKRYITVDKFCAGYTNGTALCRGDSGGGLVFKRPGTERYYLRGIVSTAHQSKFDQCDINSFTTFTNILKYEDFIMEYWDADDL